MKNKQDQADAVGSLQFRRWNLGCSSKSSLGGCSWSCRCSGWWRLYLLVIAAAGTLSLWGSTADTAEKKLSFKVHLRLITYGAFEADSFHFGSDSTEQNTLSSPNLSERNLRNRVHSTWWWVPTATKWEGRDGAVLCLSRFQRCNLMYR